jgi:hypothetical protein
MSSSEIADGETLARLVEDERHFHTIQAGVRGLASSWVLATFAGIALLLQARKESTWLFHPLPLVIVICLMANCGLSVLWIIDQLVYQRLFNTNYLAGLRLEQQFSFIPPVRAIQAFTTRGRSIAFWVLSRVASPPVVTVVPIKSQSGPITSTMGKLLLGRSRCGMPDWGTASAPKRFALDKASAPAEGKHMGRPSASLIAKRLFGSAMKGTYPDQK